MTETEHDGGMCLRCGAVNFGENLEEHRKLHFLEEGDKIRVTLETSGGGDIVALARVEEEGEYGEYGEAYMCEFLKITQNGKDRTEDYIDAIGRKRGIPHSNMDENVEIVTEE